MNLSLTHLLINKYLPPSTVLSLCEYLFVGCIHLQLKKEKKDREVVNCSVEKCFAVFLLTSPCSRSWSGRCGFKKLNHPLVCGERCDWWARWSPWRRAGNRSRSSQRVGALSVWPPFRKVARGSETELWAPRGELLLRRDTFQMFCPWKSVGTGRVDKNPASGSVSLNYSLDARSHAPLLATWCHCVYTEPVRNQQRPRGHVTPM